MIITIASDHGGYQYKEDIDSYLREQGHEVINLGCYSEQSVDYPDFADMVCDLVENTTADLGILVCGTGIGMSMAANRRPKIRAGLCKDVETAKLTRQHNNANVLCLGARVTDKHSIEPIVQAFISTDFEGGRHEKRLKKF
jgi:ribose 5-phosphate isomerase B